MSTGRGDQSRLEGSDRWWREAVAGGGEEPRWRGAIAER